MEDLGNIFIHAGDRIKRTIDRVDNVIEIVVDQLGRVIAVVLDEISKFMGEFINRIGKTIKKVVDDLDDIVGWVIEGIGDLFNPTKIPETAPTVPSPTIPLTPSLIPPVTMVGNNINQVQLRLIHLSPNSPSINLTLTDGTR